MCKVRKVHCVECAAVVETKKDTTRFCGAACRMAWNNRRRDRGAQLYDLFRAMRRERGKAAEMGLWSIACALELSWQEEDQAERPGRRSYLDAKAAVEALYDAGQLQRGEVLVKGKARKA